MYFQQIFWCLYNKGSDLAGDIRLKKKNHMQARALEYATFPQKWRQEGRRRGWGWQKKSKKRTPEQMAEVKKAMALRCPDLKDWKFASCFCLNFVENCELASERKPSLVLDSVVNNVFENKPYIHWHFFCFCFSLYQDAAICLHIQNTVINTNRRLKREHQLNLANQEYGQLR